MSEELKNDTTAPATNDEPRTAWAALPVWMVVLMSALAYRGCIYVDSAGGFQAKVYPPYHEAPPVLGGTVDPMAQGKKLYETYCVICHQPTLMGVPGQFPPLAGSEWVQADGVNRIARGILAGLQGPITVSGQAFNNAMPPWKDVITKDEDVAAILTYIRQTGGNKAGPVTAGEIKVIRTEEKDRGSAYSADELMKLPVK